MEEKEKIEISDIVYNLNRLDDIVMLKILVDKAKLCIEASGNDIDRVVITCNSSNHVKISSMLLNRWLLNSKELEYKINTSDIALSKIKLDEIGTVCINNWSHEGINIQVEVKRS